MLSREGEREPWHLQCVGPLMCSSSSRSQNTAATWSLRSLLGVSCDREVLSPRFYTAQATHNCHERPCTAPINKTPRNLNGDCLHLHAVPWANLMLLSHRRRLVLKAPHIVLRHTDKSQAPRIQVCRRCLDPRRTQGRGVFGTISNRNFTRSMPRRLYQ